ncbi:MAG: pilin [Patescibacteria group bacterium]
MINITRWLILAVILINLFSPAQADAQGILPRANPTLCQERGSDGNRNDSDHMKALQDRERFDAYVTDRTKMSEVLGCAIKLGRIRLFMLPFFITYLIQFLLEIAGLVAVIFVMLGGFKYAVGGLTEDKEAGKKYIQHALIGLVVALSGWMIVNLIQVALTS